MNETVENKKRKLVPLTKILASLLFSLCAIVLVSPIHLAILASIEVMLVVITGQFTKQYKSLMAFVIFACVLGAIQYAFTTDIMSSIESGLRMFCMATIFLVLMVTTSLQNLTTSLVDQCKMPYEYAFMFTAALRFIPDFIGESEAVREAQMCRGMDLKSSFSKRIKAYSGLVQPLVLRSLARSETMALSLELRGFGSEGHTFSQKVSMQKLDYICVGVMLIGTIFVFCVRLGLF